MGLYPVAIVGAGPVGLFAAAECCARGQMVLLLESLPNVGGQCSVLYPNKPLSGVPGTNGDSAQELVDALYKQLQQYTPTIKCETLVTRITRESHEGEGPLGASKGLPVGNYFSIDCVSGHNGQVTPQQFYAQRVIISTGGGELAPNKLVAENVENYAQDYVHYFIKSSKMFSGKNVVIAGGGNAAVDWALELIPIAKSVTLVHRRSSFRSHSEYPLNEQEALGNLVIYRNAQIVKLTGEDGILQSVHVSILGGATKKQEEIKPDELKRKDELGKKNHSATEQTCFSELPHIESINADELIVLFGLAVPTCNDWGATTKGHRIIVNPTTCETSVPGMYAIGDAIWRESGIYSILPGFAEALTVAHTIKRELS
ncbi:MAG: NAD(P)/FAD-dependent oxidoreductase [Holosporales bacterium]|nr:NAD(P)/FAD-dependent oxidoreductase [Holosporales bacterium]